MTTENQGSTGEVGEHDERAERILDATLGLVLRWGYRKTTVADIAHEAGVGKGTIYLHWRTRDEVFEALVERERARVYREIAQRLAQDPEGWTLRGIVKHTALATMKNRLIRALFLNDRGVLGKLADSEMSTEAYARRLAGFETYLEMLREHGVVRTDLGLREEVYIWSAALTGVLLAAPLMPEAFHFPDEVMADLVAEMVHGALETDRRLAPHEMGAISEALARYAAHSAANVPDAQLEDE